MNLVTPTGRVIDAGNPQPDDICLEDIAIGLSREERYNGNTIVPYTVAQHSVHVADYVASARCAHTAIVKAALLHDASEAYLGDIVMPLKALLPDYRRLEEVWSRAIFNRFDVPLALLDHPVVKQADHWIFACEVGRLIREPNSYGISGPEADWRYERVKKDYAGIDGLHPNKVLRRPEAVEHFMNTAKILGLS